MRLYKLYNLNKLCGKHKLFFRILFLFFICFTLSGCLKNHNNKYLEEIKVGVILPFSDRNTVFGPEIKNVLTLAVEEINLAGGVKGKDLILEFKDGDCNYDISKSSMEEFVDEGFEFVIGGVCSDETLGAGLVAQKNNILLFSPSSISSRITNLGDFIFRTVPPIKSSSVKLANEIYDDGYKKVAIINEVSGYTESLKEDFISQYEDLGGQIVYDFSFSLGYNNFSSVFEDISNSGAESFVFIFQNPNFEKKFILELKNSDLFLAMYGDIILVTDDVYKVGGDYLDGTKIVVPFVDDKVSEFEDFTNKFELKYNYYPNKVPNFYYSAAYDLPFILKKAMSECLKLTPECVRDNLYGIKYKGVSGNLSFNAYGDPKFNIGVFQILNDRLVLIK